METTDALMDKLSGPLSWTEKQKLLDDEERNRWARLRAEETSRMALGLRDVENREKWREVSERQLTICEREAAALERIAKALEALRP